MTRDKRRKGMVTVGFALETDEGLERAKAKLERKGLDLIVLNMANEPGAGFEVPTNRVTFIDHAGSEPIELLPKAAVAELILDRVEQRL